MNIDDSNDDDEIDIKNEDIFNYKGYFVENAHEDNEPKYFEFGAHFSYKELCKILQTLKEQQIEEEKKNKKVEQNIHINKKQISYRERNNTKNKKNENEFNKIMSIFKPKISSRNIGGIGNEIDNQNGLTFIPKFSLKNNLSIKKEDKNNNIQMSIFKTNFNQTNYAKIYNNFKNKIYNKNNSNIKINIINKYNKNKICQIKKKKFSERNVLTRNRNQNYLYQQKKLFSNNKSLNQENNNFSYNINLNKSFQTQIKDKKSKSIKIFNMENLSFLSNSKERIYKKKKNINKNINGKKCIKNGIKFNYNLIKKKNFPIKKHINIDLKLDKISNNSCSNYKNKNKNLPLECLFNNHKTKKSKYSIDLSNRILNILPEHKVIYNSFKLNSKNKERMKNFSFKKNIPLNIINNSSISFSMENNNRSFSKNKTIEKIKFYKEIEKNLNQSLTCKGKIIFSNLSFDCINKSYNKRSEYNNKKVDTSNSKDNINNLFFKKEKNSRNINNNFFIDNTTSINITDYKSFRNINNNDLLKINKTQQNRKFNKINSQRSKLNKTFINLKKNIENNKKIFIGIPCSSNKKNAIISSFSNNYIVKNFNSTGYINKICKKNKLNSHMYRLFINKSNKKFNYYKEMNFNLKKFENNQLKNKKIINSTNNDISIYNNSNINNILNNSSNKNFGKYCIPNNSNKILGLINMKKKFNKNLKPPNIKNIPNLGEKKDSKNKVNISININNNSNIIYNKIINNKPNNISNDGNNDKNNLKSNIKKVVKSPNPLLNKSIKSNSKLGNDNSFLIKGKNKNILKISNNNLKNSIKSKYKKIQIKKESFNIIKNNK